MKKVIYEMEVLSSAIISPRSGQAFYKGVDFCLEPEANVPDSSKIQKKAQEVGVIYPFYQYGEYEKYDPEHAVYYIPGSSIKGALCSLESSKRPMMVDDIVVPNSAIVLRNLWKGQYLEQENQAKMETFFGNVGVEMIKKGTRLEGEIYLDEQLHFPEILSDANKGTAIKIGQMCEYFQTILRKQDKKEAFYKTVEQAQKSLRLLQREKNMLLIGGYKGLLHSIQLKNKKNLAEIKSGVFLDPESKLPHGLVKIQKWREII
ncbi:MAG: hypothetical protein ACLSX5_13020 [Lachnospiraceae bacterium]